MFDKILDRVFKITLIVTSIALISLLMAWTTVYVEMINLYIKMAF